MADIEVAGLVTRLSIDDTDLEKSMAELNRSMKIVQSEFKKASSGLEDFGKGADGLRIKSDSLTKQLDIQGVRVAKLNEQYQKSVQEKGKDAVETQKLEARLNSAVAEYNTLEAELRRTNKELEVQSSRWTQLGASLESASKKMQDTGRAMTDAGKSLTATVTAPLVATGGLALKTAIDFESAFAGVRKTVDATEAEFAQLSAGIREMSRNMPQAATEIAGVAEAAGQLGIQNDAILGFTKTMVNMGVATNMSSETAAMSLARLATITGMNQQEFDRLGSTIVYLGNNLAATESEITEMGLRIAGAGNVVGMAEHQILAFAGSLAAVGISAEAGGTAFSKLMVNIANEVASGGKKLEGFAAVAGMSASQFQQSFERDAASAIVAFIEGLGGIQEAGGNVFGVLEALGLTEVRLRDALLRAAGAGDVMRNSLEMGAKAWAENNALTEEAEQRYQTAASQLQIFKNRLADVGISLGNALIPALLKTLDAMQPLINMLARGAEWFANLPKGVQTTAIAFAGLAAAVGPTLMITGGLINSVGTIVGALGKLTTALGAAGGAAAVFSRSIALLTGPIGIAITAISTLVGLGVALHRTLGRDALPAVQSFGEASQASLDRAAGSFKKFRGESETAMKETAKTAQVEGVAIGENLASGVASGTKKGADEAVKAVRDMVESMKSEVDRNRDALNRLGDALTQALKKSYEEAERAQIRALDDRIDNEKKTSEAIIRQYEQEQDQKSKALDRQLDEEKKASDARLKIYDREYAEKLKLIDEETYRQVKALQDQIDAIDKQTEAEERARKEQEYRDRLAEYNRQLAAAETAEEREKIQRDINRAVAEHERQQLLESRRMQKDALREQIDEIKAAADERKNQLKQEIEDQKEAEKQRLAAIQESLSEQKTALKTHYTELKEVESDRLKDFVDSLDSEKEAIKEHYAELTTQENLQAEARKLIVEKNNDEIVRLLETYVPKWQDAGQSFSDAFATGLNSEKQTIEEAVSGITNIAPAISGQIKELDRLQAKLKELEDAAKGAGGVAGGTGGIPAIALGFEEATLQATEFAEALQTEVNPAVEELGQGIERMSEDSLAAIIGLGDEAIIKLNELFWSGSEVTDEMAETIAETYYAMGEEILKNLDASHADQISSLQTFFQNTSELTAQEQEQMMQDLLSAQEKERKEIEDSQQRIFEILSNAFDEQRKLTQAEYDEINEIQRKFTATAEEIFSEYELTQKALIERMRADAGEVTAAQAAEVVKNSIEQRDGAIKAAEEQYEEVLKMIIRQRDETGTISADQADRLIREAKRQKDEAISAAKEMHEKVVAEAKKQAEEHVKKIDWETGEALKGWEAYKVRFGEIWSELVDSFKPKEEEMFSVGRNLITGFWNGIQSMNETIKTGSRNLAKNFVTGFKNELEIRSPSRVMMRVGHDVGEGLAIGLQDMIADIERKAKAMASAATPVMGTIGGPALAGAGAREGSNIGETHNNYNFERIFEGATIIVRSDNDLKTLARELFDLTSSKGRSEGVR